MVYKMLCKNCPKGEPSVHLREGIVCHKWGVLRLDIDGCNHFM